MGVEPRPYKSDALPDKPLSFLYHLCLKQSPVPCTTMHNWFCQIELIQLIWQKKAKLKESSNAEEL